MLKARNHVKRLLLMLLALAFILSTAFYIYRLHVRSSGIVKISTSAQFPKGFPWNLQLLSRPPKVTWLNKTGKIKSLYYEGLPYQGEKTDVFAYYATPGSINGDLSKDHNLPGIVIVHGGCQAADKSVVNLWAQRGYAAISMDLDGHGPAHKRLRNAGPPAEAYMSYDWNYHAIAKIILAHSLLLSFPAIDKSRTGIVGLSVGGHLTCIVAGIDNRFKAAASVYGTGFIYKKGFFRQWYQGILEDQRPGREGLSPEEQRVWRDLIDPSNYLKNISCPFLFAGNPNDKYYPLAIRIKSYEQVKGPCYLYIDPSLQHSNVGHFLYILKSFFDQYLKAGPPLPVLHKIEKKGDKLYVRSSDVKKGHSAYVYFTTDAGPYDNRKWRIYTARIDQDGIEADLPPDNTVACFVNYLVNEHVIISSKVLIMNQSFLQ